MDTFISPNYKRSDLTGADVQKKMEIFKDRVNGWQLDIAEQCCKIDHSGFAVLSIILSYFEMIGSFRKGNTEHSNFDEFKDGLIYVFPYLNVIHRDDLYKLYKQCRHGMYHIGMTRSDITLNGNYSDALNFNNDVWMINPEKLVADLRRNLDKYLNDLQICNTLKNNFENAFDQIIPPLPILPTPQPNYITIILPSGVSNI